MKRLFILLLILAASVWIGLQISNNPGYFIIVNKYWTLKTPLWFATFIFILSLILFHYFMRCISGIAGLPQRWKFWLKKRRERYAENEINQHLLASLCERSTSLDTCLASLAQIEKKKLLANAQIQLIKEKCYAGKIQEFANTGNLHKLDFFWKNLSKAWRKKPLLLTAYVKGLIQLGQNKKAETLIRYTVNKTWDSNLIYLYGLIAEEDKSTKYLSRAEHWLKHYPYDANLLLTLGRLCIRHQLWGKARSYLTTSLSEKVQTETYKILGELLEQLNEKEAALQYYKKALLLKNDNSPPFFPYRRMD